MPPFDCRRLPGPTFLTKPLSPRRDAPLNIAPCRDCGLEIDLDSRGCPKCARNLDAERAVAKFVLWAAALLVAGLVPAACLLLRG